MIATPNNGTPLGGQTVTLTGEAFGATQLPVMFGAAEAEVVSWAASEVVVTTPRVPFATGSVEVTCGAFEASYLFNRPLADIAEELLAAELRLASVNDGFYFNHNHQNQVKSLRGDPWVDDACNRFPRTYINHIMAAVENDTPYGYDKDEVTIMVVGLVKSELQDATDLTSLCHFYVADVAKALCSDRGVGGNVNDVRITQAEFMGADVEGAMEVNIMLSMQVQHYYQNHNKNEGSLT